MNPRHAILMLALCLSLSACVTYPSGYREEVVYADGSYYSPADDSNGDYYYAPADSGSYYNDSYYYPQSSSIYFNSYCYGRYWYCSPWGYSGFYAPFYSPGFSLFYRGHGWSGGFSPYWGGYGYRPYRPYYNRPPRRSVAPPINRPTQPPVRARPRNERFNDRSREPGRQPRFQSGQVNPVWGKRTSDEVAENQPGANSPAGVGFVADPSSGRASVPVMPAPANATVRMRYPDIRPDEPPAAYVQVERQPSRHSPDADQDGGPAREDAPSRTSGDRDRRVRMNADRPGSH